jgi:hypothetical protein
MRVVLLEKNGIIKNVKGKMEKGKWGETLLVHKIYFLLTEMPAGRRHLIIFLGNKNELSTFTPPGFSHPSSQSFTHMSGR